MYAHGLFSWVPKMVREKTLQLIQACLKPGGIAYLSYNVLPGWRMRSALRDILLHATANREGAAANPSKPSLTFCCKNYKAEN